MQHKRTNIVRVDRTIRWMSLLFAGLLVAVLCLVPGTAQAQSTAQEPDALAELPLLRARLGDAGASASPHGIFSRLRQRLMRLRQAPLLLRGTVTAADESSLTIELAPLRDAVDFASERRAGWLAHSREFTFAVNDDSLLLDNALGTAVLSDVAVGDAVTLAPELAWGRPTVRFLFQGTPQDLRNYAFVGRVNEETDDALQVQMRGAATTVRVDEHTLWVDNGMVQSRPTELRAGLPLRILGIEEEDGSIRAVIVTSIP